MCNLAITSSAACRCSVALANTATQPAGALWNNDEVKMLRSIYTPQLDKKKRLHTFQPFIVCRADAGA